MARHKAVTSLVMALGGLAGSTAPAPEHDYRAESDARALIEAADIKRDKARHAKAMAFMRDAHKGLAKAIATHDGRGRATQQDSPETLGGFGKGYRAL